MEFVMMEKSRSSEVTARMEFMQLDAEAQAKIGALKSILERELPVGLDKFYGRVRATPETRRFFSSEEHIKKAKGAQIGHWAAISSGTFNEQYAANVRSIGQTHARIGLEPRWYMGGYAVVLDHLIQSAIAELWPTGFLQRSSQKKSKEVGQALGALVKAVILDMELAISVYLEAAEEARLEFEAAQAKERDAVTRAVAAGMAKLAARDLTYRMQENMPDAYIALQHDFNRAVEQLQDALGDVTGGVAKISSAAHEITAAADGVSRRTEQQAASIEETAAALQEITTTIKKSADGALNAHRIVTSTKDEAEKSSDVMREAVDAMKRIEKSSQNIEQIIAAIDEIAFQTNLLALNAGVEAARAGEAGRGFAVVASEVRALAQRSAEAAKEIKTLIAASTSEVKAGVTLVAQTGVALERIAKEIIAINEVVSEIAQGATEQSGAVQQINVAVSQMDRDTQENAAMVEETTAACHDLRNEATDLAQRIQSFRIASENSRPVLRLAAGAETSPRIAALQSA
jgi:methyl-accepting chemotaxis protein